MNSVHDIGGTDGFGAIDREADEPVFHQLWEGRVFGMFLTGAGLPSTPLDAFRHRLEQLAPLKYLGSTYYERWLAALERALVEAGTLTLDEIETRVKQFAVDPDVPMPRHEDPVRAEHLAQAVREGRPDSQRKIRQKPRLAVGDKVVTRNLNPHGHTRLPRYARGKRGVIAAHYGAHVFPDTNAHGLGENPQHLYSVRFLAHELWGDGAEPNQSVHIDLWESYLDKQKAQPKSMARNTVSGAKKSVGKSLAQPVKKTAHVGSRRSPAESIPSIKLTSTPAARKETGTRITPGESRQSTSRGSSAKPVRRSR